MKVRNPEQISISASNTSKDPGPYSFSDYQDG